MVQFFMEPYYVDGTGLHVDEYRALRRLRSQINEYLAAEKVTEAELELEVFELDEKRKLLVAKVKTR